MAVYHAQIGFQLDTALPRDMVTINPHYHGDNPQALGDALKTNLIANANVGAAMPFTVKIYDALKGPPNYPLYTTSNGTGFVPSTKPREVGLCLSYYSTYNRKSYRGRLYIPGALIPGGMALRPTGTQMSSVVAWKATIGKGLPSAHNWVVYSRKLGLDNGVSHVWCDDEWDITRSRGLRGTTRVLETLAA